MTLRFKGLNVYITCMHALLLMLFAACTNAVRMVLCWCFWNCIGLSRPFSHLHIWNSW